jgi:hypothetical protein
MRLTPTSSGFIFEAKASDEDLWNIHSLGKQE